MRKIYIVSIVFARMEKAINGTPPQVDLQNSVGITPAGSADEAYMKVLRKERLKFPQHKVAVRNVIETSEIDLNMIDNG